MEAERSNALFGGSWPKLKGYSPGQAAWNRAESYAPVPGGVELAAERLLYVAVDNIFEDTARLVASRWPKQGVAGRLTFGSTAAVWVSVKRFGELIAGQRLMPAADQLPPERREEVLLRPPAVGDVFASRRPDDLERLASIAELELERWLAPPIVDISAEMRVEAKAAFYAAVAPVLATSELRRVQGGE